MEQIQHFLYTPFLYILFYLLQYTQIEHNRMRSRCKQCSGTGICASTTAKGASTSNTRGRASASTTAGASCRAGPSICGTSITHTHTHTHTEHCLIKVFFHSRVFKYKFLSLVTSLPLSEQTISSPTCGLACESIHTFYSLQVHYECQSLLYTASESVTTSLFSGTS